MKSIHIKLNFAATLTGLSLLAVATLHAQQAQAVRPNQNEAAVARMSAVPIGEWQPQSSLVVPETDVRQARYPAIDLHGHIYAQTPAEVAEWVGVMDQVGIDKTVILAGAVGDRFDEAVELYLKPYPERFVLFAGILQENINAPDYPQRAVAELERCYRMGARGLGELTDKGLGFTADPSLSPDQRLHPDDPRLDLFWKKAEELKLPANVHFADHPSAWEPPDHAQERTPGYQRYNQHGLNDLSHADVLMVRDRFLSRHPNNIVIACHLSNEGHDMATLTKTLEAFPNLYLDISARQYEYGRQPRQAAKFFKKFKDRILFGTDMGREAPMYRSFWRLLETADEYLPGQSWWMLYGLELPDDVLRALYRDNAMRILNWDKP